MNKHQKDTCYNDIKLVCPQNPLSISGFMIVERNEMAYVVIKERK
jgi:hypothetical protein